MRDILEDFKNPHLKILNLFYSPNNTTLRHFLQSQLSTRSDGSMWHLLQRRNIPKHVITI